MSSHKLPDYLRTYRRRSGLTQDQMAFLLGCKSGSKVSRYERRTRLPSLATALAYQIVLHAPIETLFAGLYEQVMKKTERRARVLAKRLSQPPKLK